MTHTVFRDDHTLLVPNRAYAYAPEGFGGYRLSIPDFAIAGATSLFTTVEDLAHWNRNFGAGIVGGSGLLRQLQERGELNDGARLSYAFGLMHGTHRGRRTISHGGTDASYRSEFLRFPDEDAAVAVLCNTGIADPGRLARDVADIMLPRPARIAGPARETAPRPPADRALPPEPDRDAAVSLAVEPANMAGYYRRPGNDVPLRIVARGENLTLVARGVEQPLRRASDGRFLLRGATEVTLAPGDGEGAAPVARGRRVPPHLQPRGTGTAVAGGPRRVRRGLLQRRPGRGIHLPRGGRRGSSCGTARSAASRWRRRSPTASTAPAGTSRSAAPTRARISGFTVSTSRAWNIPFRRRR